MADRATKIAEAAACEASPRFLPPVSSPAHPSACSSLIPISRRRRFQRRCFVRGRLGSGSAGHYSRSSALRRRRRRRPRARRLHVLVTSICFGFFAGGVLLAAVAWQRAWRPPLRVVFEELAREQRRQAEADGRRLPEDDEAFAVVEGTLRADASPSESGVSLSVDVDWIGGQDGQEGRERQEGRGRAGRAGCPGAWPAKRGRRRALALRSGSRAAGGIAVTVVGSLAAARLDDWRAGRRVRMPAQLAPPVALSRSRRPGSRARAGPARDDARRDA